jgi:hypothetical protein
MACKRESLGFFPARCAWFGPLDFKVLLFEKKRQGNQTTLCAPGTSALRRGRRGSLAVLLLAEQRRGWSLMIFYARATRGLRRMRRERPGALLARRTRTMKRIGRTPTLVLCSRNAHPEKGLVRRPHVDQHGCPSKRGKASELGGIK